MQAVALIGMPESDLALAQATLYLATAPKSNRVTLAYGHAKADVHEGANPPVPLHLRNAPMPWLREMGRSVGYLYPHDFEAGLVVQDYLPEALLGRMYYEPSDEGYERTLSERLRGWREFRERLGKSGRNGLPRTGAAHPAPGPAGKTSGPDAGEAGPAGT
jgi:putative ATPase